MHGGMPHTLETTALVWHLIISPVGIFSLDNFQTEYYGCSSVPSTNTINITITCIFTLPDVFMMTDYAPVSLMVYQNTQEFCLCCLFGLVGNYLLSKDQWCVSESLVSFWSQMVTSGKVRFFTIEKSCSSASFVHITLCWPHIPYAKYLASLQFLMLSVWCHVKIAFHSVFEHKESEQIVFQLHKNDHTE